MAVLRWLGVRLGGFGVWVQGRGDVILVYLSKGG